MFYILWFQISSSFSINQSSCLDHWVLMTLYWLTIYWLYFCRAAWWSNSIRDLQVYKRYISVSIWVSNDGLLCFKTAHFDSLTVTLKLLGPFTVTFNWHFSSLQIVHYYISKTVLIDGQLLIVHFYTFESPCLAPRTVHFGQDQSFWRYVCHYSRMI